MVSLLSVYRNSAYRPYMMEMSEVVLDCGLQGLDISTCYRCTDINLPVKFCILWIHTVEQSLICSARQNALAEHFPEAAEGLSSLTVVNEQP